MTGGRSYDAPVEQGPARRVPHRHRTVDVPFPCWGVPNPHSRGSRELKRAGVVAGRQANGPGAPGTQWSHREPRYRPTPSSPAIRPPH